jgi:hypothetical protein
MCSHMRILVIQRLNIQYIGMQFLALVSLYILLMPLSVTVHHSIGTQEGTQFYSCHTYKFRPYILKVTFVVLVVVSWCHRVVRLMCTDLSEAISDEGGTKFLRIIGKHTSLHGVTFRRRQ